MNRICRLLLALLVCTSANADLRGVITDSLSKPVAYATVLLKSTGGLALTDSAGQFAIATGTPIRFRPSRDAQRSALQDFTSPAYSLTLDGRIAAGTPGSGQGGEAVAVRVTARQARLLISGRRLAPLPVSGREGTGLARRSLGYGAPDSILITRKGYRSVALAVNTADTQVVAVTVTPARRTIAATTASVDYSSGNIGMLDAGTMIARVNLHAIHSDNLVRTGGRWIYVLERLGKDNLIRLDTSGAVDFQRHIGDAVNLQDIGVVSETRAYITQWHRSGLIVFNSVDAKVADTIDLSRFNTYAGSDSAETSPYASSVAVYGTTVLVACQRLKQVQTTWGVSYDPADSSLIAIIDATTDSVVGSVKLALKNPTALDIFHNKLYVSCTGSWMNPADGGIECIDLSTRVNLGVVLTETQLGGNISQLALVSPTKGYVCVGKNSADWTSFWTEVIPFDLFSAKVDAKLPSVANAFGGLVYDGFALYVGDRAANASGVVAVNPVDGSKIAGPVSVGLPPSSIAVVEY